MKLIRALLVRIQTSLGRRLAVVVGAVMALLVLATSLYVEQPSTLPDSASPLASLHHPEQRIEAPSTPQQLTAPASADESTSVGETQICGGAWVEQGADGHPDADVARRAGLAATARRVNGVVDAMSRSADERTRAVGDIIGTFSSFEVDASCDDGTPCASARVTAQAQAASHRHHLIEAARTTSDPQVYAWAYQSCTLPTQVADEACASLDSTQWARLDSSNAVAWLAVASAAGQRHDLAAVDDAMFHVANATRYDDGENVAAAILIDQRPSDDESLLTALHLAGVLLGLDASAQFNGAGKANAYCRAHELGDANRRETCNRIGESMLAHSTSLFPWIVGKAIGGRLDWPADRLHALDDQLAAFKLLRDSNTGDSAIDSYSCPALRKWLDGIRDTSRIGEVATLRRELLASGKPASQLADTFRAAQARDAVLNAALAASQAAAASAALAAGGQPSAAVLPDTLAR